MPGQTKTEAAGPPAALEDVACACARAAMAPALVWSTLAAAQVDWWSQMSAALLAGGSGRPDWYRGHPTFELGFLLGKCGEEHPFPCD